MFNLRLLVKIVDFHGEVTLISVFGGIKDIFEARFISSFVSKSSNIHILLLKCGVHYSDVTIDRDH
jgi:hypothetical protein